MPFTHIEIEERESRTIALLFTSLVLLYAGSIVALVWTSKYLSVFSAPLRAMRGGSTISLGTQLIALVITSLGFGLLHWVLSIHRLLERTLDAIGARPLDTNDLYHTKLCDIVNEVSVATGGRRIESYVIATPAVNACSISDFDGRAAIAVTEGALAIFNRAQLESVVGHEVAHIVSGDSLTTTVFCALFALHEETLKGLSGMFATEREGRVVGGLFMVMIYLVLSLTHSVKTLCTILISREKEYRADAVAVRLTRDPLSLAEALSLLSKKWHGVGTRGESLSSLFIMDPGTEALSEQEGLVADLFSTHPPTERRIERLLGMAHLDLARFDEEMSADIMQKQVRSSPSPAPLEVSPSSWMVWSNGTWAGPFGLQEITKHAELSPDSWVRRVDEPSAKPVHADPQLLTVLRQRYGGVGVGNPSLECPRCHVGLVSTAYEGAAIDRCPACQGCYVDSSNMVKIFSREEYEIPDAIKRMGDLLLTPKGYAAAKQQLQAGRDKVAKEWPCSRCGAAVVRKFYTEDYPVEVDQCWECGFVWLDHEELELLQYLYEKRRDSADSDDEVLPGEAPPAI